VLCLALACALLDDLRTPEALCGLLPSALCGVGAICGRDSLSGSVRRAGVS
jgi:hypothetical protein